MADYAAEILDPPAASEPAGVPDAPPGEMTAADARPGEMTAADARPGVAIAADVLVEEISIDGMCGVY